MSNICQLCIHTKVGFKLYAAISFVGNSINNKKSNSSQSVMFPQIQYYLPQRNSAGKLILHSIQGVHPKQIAKQLCKSSNLLSAKLSNIFITISFGSHGMASKLASFIDIIVCFILHNLSFKTNNVKSGKKIISTSKKRLPGGRPAKNALQR